MSIAINVIALLRDHGDLSVADIMDRLGCSWGAANRALLAMEHKRLAVRSGTRKRRKIGGTYAYTWRLTIR